MRATAMTAANPKHYQEKDHKPHESNGEQRNGCISDGSEIVHFTDIPAARVFPEAIQRVPSICPICRQHKGAIRSDVDVSRSFSNRPSCHQAKSIRVERGRLEVARSIEGPRPGMRGAEWQRDEQQKRQADGGSRQCHGWGSAHRRGGPATLRRSLSLSLSSRARRRSVPNKIAPPFVPVPVGPVPGLRRKSLEG